MGQNKEQESVLNNIQISAPLGNDRRIRRKDTENPAGKEETDCENEKAADHASVLESEEPVFLCEGGKEYAQLQLEPYALPATDELIRCALETQKKLYATDAKVVDTMVSAFGCKTEDIRAAIGPNIGACCFETHSDVPEAMLAALGEEARPYIFPAGEKFRVDLKGINALILRRAGVKNIEIAAECTVCQSHRFWSHRVTKGQRGSQISVIIKEENG